MATEIIGRPGLDECHPYYRTYIDKVVGDNIINILETAKVNFATFLRSIPADKWDYRYAPDKWTLKESIIHLLDAERVFAYRCLRIARNDQTPMPGFEQDDYIPFYNAEARTAASVIAEYEAVREASIQLFKSMSEADFARKGTASGSPMTPLAGAFMIAGHEEHHHRLTMERYL